MALHWDMEKVKDRKELFDEVGSGIFDAIIWSTMAVGLGGITEKNVDKYFERLMILDKVDGPYLRDKEGPKSWDYATVKRFIGLSTNVANDSDAVFKKKIWDALVRDTKARVKNRKADAEKAAEKEEEVAAS